MYSPKADDRLEKRQLSVQISDLLAEEITAMETGAKLPTISQLAARYGVSVLTIREAVAALTQRGLVERSRGRAMRVADRRADQHVAVLIEMDIAHPNTPFPFRRMCQVAMQRLRENGFRARLYAGHVAPQDPPPTNTSTCPEFLEAVQKGQLCGLITIASLPQALWLEPLLAQGVPVVGQGAYEYGVELNYPDMVERGVRYLLDHGRKRIAFMEWKPSWDTPQRVDSFLQTFSRAMRKAGVPIRDEWIRYDLHPSHPGSGWEGFREIWNAFEEKPDGLLVCDDNLMRDAVIGIVGQRIRVPEELLIVSHANKGSGIAYPFPVMEFVADPEAMAAAQVDLLVARMQGEAIAHPKVVIPFVARDTSAAQSVSRPVSARP